MKKLLALGSLAISLAFSHGAIAASTDFIDNGSFTTDTLSDLDWLDVTTTRGLSFDAVSGQLGAGGDYAGYRYATGVEFNQMIMNYTSSAFQQTNYSQVYHGTAGLDGLVRLLGSTYDDFYFERYGRTYSSFVGAFYTMGFLSDTHLTSSANHFAATTYENTVSTTVRDWSIAHSYIFPGSLPHLEIGSYLVRDTLIATPIPAALFMFAPALLGFLGFRRKFQA